MTIDELIEALDAYGGHLGVFINVHDDKPLEGIADITTREFNGTTIVEIVVSDDRADRPK